MNGYIYPAARADDHKQTKQAGCRTSAGARGSGRGVGGARAGAGAGRGHHPAGHAAQVHRVRQAELPPQAPERRLRQDRAGNPPGPAPPLLHRPRCASTSRTPSRTAAPSSRTPTTTRSRRSPPPSPLSLAPSLACVHALHPHCLHLGRLGVCQPASYQASVTVAGIVAPADF